MFKKPILISLVIFIVFVNVTVSSHAAEVKRLEGWREFTFGMSPSQVESVSSIPLKCDPLNAMGGGVGNLFITDVSIEGTPFRVALAFKGASYGYSCDFPRASLNRITLVGGPLQPCPFEKVLGTLERTYGPFKSSDDGFFIVRQFENNTEIQVQARGSTNPGSACSIQIKYVITAPVPPSLPPLPNSRF